MVIKVILIGLAVVGFGFFAYWHLIITEGVYLGQWVVTFLYDLVAPRYDKIKGFDAGFEKLFIGAPLIKLLAGKPAPLILDVATGTGRVPLALFQEPNFQGKIIALDHSVRMLRIAVDGLQEDSGRITFIHRDASQLPFIDDSFDAITCLEMVEFTPSPQDQLAEILRVLRPGGWLLTTRRRGRHAMLMPGKTHTEAEFESILVGLGLVEVKTQMWQVEYDLVWGRKPGTLPDDLQTLEKLLTCPDCGSAGFDRLDNLYRCDHCGRILALRESILEFD